MVDNYFNSQLKGRITKGLTRLSDKIGVTDDYLFFLFKHDLDEYDMTLLQQPMTDRLAFLKNRVLGVSLKASYLRIA